MPRSWVAKVNVVGSAFEDRVRERPRRCGKRNREWRTDDGLEEEDALWVLGQYYGDWRRMEERRFT